MYIHVVERIIGGPSVSEVGVGTYFQGRQNGVIVNLLDIQTEGSGFVSWPGSLCCVIGKSSLLSHCFTLASIRNKEL